MNLFVTGRISTATVAVALLAACGRQEPATPPPAAASSGTTVEAGEPAEGAARIAIAADGTHVQYRVYGQGEPVLVFIHGWSCDSNYWREQIPVFKDRHTLVTVDLAGHGGTDGSRTDWTIAKFGQDVASALAAVPGERLVLIGHSMGGPVAIEAARALGNRVAGIIGVDTFKTIGMPAPTSAQVDAVMRPFEADFIGHTRKLVTEKLFAPDADRELANKVAYDMSLSPPRVAIPALRALLEYDFTEPLKDISVPVVAIESRLGEPVNEARIRKALPRFKLVTVEGPGHFLMMEAPAAFNSALEAQIRDIVPPGDGDGS